MFADGIRSCSYSASSDSCIDNQPLGVDYSTCSCSSDLCNGSDHIAISKTTMLAFGIVALVLKLII